MEELLAKALASVEDPSGRACGLVLDGQTLSFVLESDIAMAKLFSLCLACSTCVCCRLSPSQKRKLVELVKFQDTGSVTLAVGDGANDVPMIQGAHVGIGIRGKEGSQAVQSCDVAISKFRFLVPLLLCHGRRGYRRVATFLCYFLYKHVVLSTGDLIWAHQSDFV